MMLQVNVGCGEFRAEGWLNLDIYSGGEGEPKPDIIASADNMPFADGMVDRIYAGHVLEHIELEHVPYVLKEFRRVLKNDGGLLIVGPDLTRAEESYPEMIDDIKYGAARWNGDTHLWDSREATMVEILQREGWDTAVADIGPVYLSGQWPVTAGVGWQFAIFATKLPPKEA